jgi:hypothetical protein
MRLGWSRVVGVIAASALLYGCSKKEVGYSGAPTPTPTDPGPPVNPDPTPPTPPRVLYYSGVYEADAPLDFTQNGALPGLDSPALGLLANLKSQPGTALVNFGFAAGVQVLSDIGPTGRTILGSILDGQLTNLYTSNPTLNQVVTTIQNIAQIAKTTVLLNKLTVHTPSADHSTKIEIELTGATFHFVYVSLTDTTVTTSVPADKAAAAKAAFTTGSVMPRPNPNVADADLSFDKGSISVPMGDFLMQAIGELVFKPLYGSPDFKGGLVASIPCDSIAHDGAAALAGNPLASVISEPVLKTICLAGAGYLADQLIAQIQTLSADGVAISAGRGVLYDVSTSHPVVDGVADRVGDGTWTWTIGSATIMSQFAGDRIGTSP